MKKQNVNDLEKVVEKKYAKRDKRKKVKMKVNGRKVKDLQKIIRDK